MPLSFGLNIVEGKVYRSKKKNEADGERAAMTEIQTILARKNRKSCDCEAQVHDLLENCLNCGRLCCTAEGPGKCFYCGNLVLGAEQRERFKKYIDVMQPTTSSRAPDELGMKIIDNQFDHFTIDSKKHLREEDRKKLRENLEELQAQRYKRKLVLDVNVDELEAGVHSRPQIDDYEQALEDLKLDHRQEPVTESKFTLTELVKKESKCDYSFDYIAQSAKS